eukprot:GHVL01019948.1.p1 GENE.GHVL01019948.1~~GHVL01019948.1.p1  ORF type:complete len:307 (-),score=54.95 GHVL01019948.1:343-1263(-)
MRFIYIRSVLFLTYCLSIDCIRTPRRELEESSVLVTTPRRLLSTIEFRTKKEFDEADDNNILKRACYIRQIGHSENECLIVTVNSGLNGSLMALTRVKYHQRDMNKNIERQAWIKSVGEGYGEQFEADNFPADVWRNMRGVMKKLNFIGPWSKKMTPPEVCYQIDTIEGNKFAARDQCKYHPEANEAAEKDAKLWKKFKREEKEEVIEAGDLNLSRDDFRILDNATWVNKKLQDLILCHELNGSNKKMCNILRQRDYESKDKTVLKQEEEAPVVGQNEKKQEEEAPVEGQAVGAPVEGQEEKANDV